MEDVLAAPPAGTEQVSAFQDLTIDKLLAASITNDPRCQTILEQIKDVGGRATRAQVEARTLLQEVDALSAEVDQLAMNEVLGEATPEEVAAKARQLERKREELGALRTTAAAAALNYLREQLRQAERIVCQEWLDAASGLAAACADRANGHLVEAIRETKQGLALCVRAKVIRKGHDPTPLGEYRGQALAAVEARFLSELKPEIPVPVRDHLQREAEQHGIDLRGVLD